MRPDAPKVPIESRWLLVVGVASNEVLNFVKDAVPPKWSANSVWCFLSFSYADLPIGTEFQRIFSRKDVSISQIAPCRVLAVTQQMAKPFDQIPSGWKTITLLEFPDGIPELIQNLPVVDSWYQLDRQFCLGLANEETWQALQKVATSE